MKPILTSAAFLLLTCPLGTALAQTPPTEVSSVGAGLSSWRLVDVRTGGTSQITDAAPDPFGGRGSLEQTLPESPDRSFKSEIEIFSPDTTLEPVRGLVPNAGGFGRLADMHDLLVAWYRDGASTTWSWIGPAVRVYVFDPDLGVNGTSSIMVWEPVYNGYAPYPDRAVPVDQWVHSRVDEGRFWRQPLYLDGARVPRDFCSLNPTECHRYVTLDQWGFGPNAVIFGFNIAVGGGWPGDYHGYVDYLSLELVNGQTLTWDFEPPAASPVCTENRGRRRHHRRGRGRGRR